MPFLVLHKPFLLPSCSRCDSAALLPTRPLWPTVVHCRAAGSTRASARCPRPARPFFPPLPFPTQVVLGCFFISSLLLSKQPEILGALNKEEREKEIRKIQETYTQSPQNLNSLVKPLFGVSDVLFLKGQTEI